MRYVHKDFGNRQIHLGLIAHCKKGSEYGLLYGFRKPKSNGNRSIFENKLFYFKKSLEDEIPSNTLVSYLSYDYDSFSANAEFVFPLSSMVKVSDQRGTRRDDDVYHDDETWRLINEGIPFFDYQYSRNYCIYYPIIEKNVCTIWSGVFGVGIYMNKEAEIYEMFRELDRLNYSGWPSFDEINNTINEFRKYINSINAFDIIDTFEINKRCSYHSRPGKDDYYLEYLEQKLPNDDKYLSFLLPDKSEQIFYDNNAYPSDGYVSGTFLQEEETMQAREKAKEEYSKEKHLSYLIFSYFSEIDKKREKSEELKSSIDKEFDIQNAKTILSKFEGYITDELIALIDDYNCSTVVTPL